MDVRRHRLLTLRAQGLFERSPRASLLKTARQLCALQAQTASTPLLSLAARVEGIAGSDIEREIMERKSLLRVWSLRLTLHVIATEDLPLIHAAVMRDGYDTVVGMMRRHDGLSTREIRSAERAMLRDLEKGPRTRSELRRAIPAFKFSTFWGREIRCLAQRGIVVHAGRRGGEVLFDLRERWAPRSEIGNMCTREARRELLLRYLAAYGSGTAADFAYWLGVRLRDVEQAFRDAADRLQGEDGLFLLRGSGSVLPSSGVPPPRLLPRYDALLLGHKDKSRYLDPGDYKQVFRPSAVIEPVILVGGAVAGTWRYDDAYKWRSFRTVGASAQRVLRREARRIRTLL